MSELLRRRRGLAMVGVAAALLLVAACARAITRDSTSVKPTSSALDSVGGVPTVARSLSVPISECVVRRDTTHPVFHGCIDWHSAVHGNYALRVISRLTGDTKYLDIAQSVISADGLSTELSSINAGELSEEIPYGFAWFLILDREAAVADLAPLAQAVSSQLRQWIADHVDGNKLSANEYQNLSFPVFALHRWYLRSAPDEAATLRRTVVPALAKRWREPCSQASRQTGEFFDPCANLLLTLSDAYIADPTAIDAADLRSLLDEVTTVQPLDPKDVTIVHAAGVNFSRSWAIYTTAAALGRPQLIDVADQYFLASFNAPALWREQYRLYGHWVGQFGVHALDLREQARQRLSQTH